MHKFSVIEVEDSEWSGVVAKCETYDFHHTQCYHQIEDSGGKPLLCVASSGEDLIAMPVILRSIPSTQWYDCTSAYGYCGPIGTRKFNLLPLSLRTYFQEQLLEFFKSRKVITAFSRLHPLIDSTLIFKGFGVVEDINKTVAVDLRISLEDQRKQYRKSNKPEINKLRRTGFQVELGTSPEDIECFIDIYYETMERVKASENYFFSKRYFHSFINNTCFSNKLLLVKKDGEVAAGAIFTITNKIMQYHLAGTAEKYIKDTPMKLILDEARLMGSELGLNFLHLGGGVGGSDEDSLFRFKSGFSKQRGVFQVWKMILNEDVNNELIEGLGHIGENSFFPRYRYRNSR